MMIVDFQKTCSYYKESCIPCTQFALESTSYMTLTHLSQHRKLTLVHFYCLSPRLYADFTVPLTGSSLRT